MCHLQPEMAKRGQTMIRFQTLLVASSLLAVSVAQSPVVGSSEGRGVALNANGGRVNFQYNGSKLQDGTVRGGGHLHLPFALG